MAAKKRKTRTKGLAGTGSRRGPGSRGTSPGSRARRTRLRRTRRR